MVSAIDGIDPASIRAPGTNRSLQLPSLWFSETTSLNTIHDIIRLSIGIYNEHLFLSLNRFPSHGREPVYDRSLTIMSIILINTTLSKSQSRPASLPSPRKAAMSSEATEVIEGAVASRIQQLGRGRRSIVRSDPHPISLPERNGEQVVVGSGRKIGSEAPFVQPASHIRTIEPWHDPPTLLGEHSYLPAIIRRSTLPSSTEQYHADDADADRESDTLSHRGDQVHDSDRSSDKCHTCGGKVESRAICPSCNHMCGSKCTQVVPEDPIPQHKPSDDALSTETLKPAPLQTTPRRKSVAATARNQSELAGDQVKPLLKNEPTGTNSERLSVRNNPFVIADQIEKARLAKPQTWTPPARTYPSSKLRDPISQFGDQHGSAKSTSSAKKSFYERLQASATQNNAHMDSDSKSGQDAPNSGPTPSANGGDMTQFMKPKEDVLLQVQAPSVTVSPRREEKNNSSSLKAEPSESSAASSSDLSSVIKRVKVLAREPNSGEMGQVLEVNMEGAGGQSKGLGKPKAHISSPPSWLKNPSAEPGSIQGRLRHVDDSASAPDSSKQPDSSQRLQRHNNESEVKNPEIDDLNHHIRAQKATHVEAANFTEGDDEQGSASEETQRPWNPLRKTKTVGSMVSPGGAEATRKTTEAITSTASGAAAATTNARAKLFEKGDSPSRPLSGQSVRDHPHTRQWLDDIQQRHQSGTGGLDQEGATMATPRQACGQEAEPESKMNDLSSRRSSVFRKARLGEVSHGEESDLRKARSLGLLPGEARRSVGGEEVGQQIHQQIEESVGIRGLTIVLHLRGKDDLVISTDLTREAHND
ncbi:hypothetical protein V8F20_003753 [Naviculisporaceae sp. PSN 640]